MTVSFLRPGLFLSLLVLALLGLGLALMSAGAAARAELEAGRVTGAYTVRVLTPAGEDTLAKAAAALAATPGVASAKPMDAARAARLLTRWGGNPVDESALPPLRLIEVRAATDSEPVKVAGALAESLRAAGVAAEIYDAGPAKTEAPAIVRIGVLGGLGAVGAALLAIAFTAAAAARADRIRAKLWADHGAARGLALAAFGRAGAEIAFLAGAAAVLIALLITPGVRFMAGEAISFGGMIVALSPWDLLLAFATPLAATAAGALGARMGAAGAFDAADRLG